MPSATTRDSLGRVELAFLLRLEHVEHVGEREQTVAVARLLGDQRQRLVPRARSLHAGHPGLVEFGIGHSTTRVGDATTNNGARLDVHGTAGYAARRLSPRFASQRTQMRYTSRLSCCALRSVKMTA